MDFGTILGFVVGSTLFIWAISSGGTSIRDFVDLPSIMITLGGTVAAAMVNYPLSQLIGIVRVSKQILLAKPPDFAATIQTLVGFADRARREGLLALEDSIAGMNEPFLQKGLQLVVDGTDPELVRTILETELAFLEDRHKAGAGMFDQLAVFAPAFGMIGTLVGLIAMLKNLNDPSAIGPAMALALLTTLYGSLIANFICLPIAGKLRTRSAEEVLNREIMLEGILSIQAGDSPRILEDKLKSFLSPNQRSKQVGAGNAAAARAAAEEV